MSQTPEVGVQVTSRKPFFCAGVWFRLSDDGVARIHDAAPILHYTVGWTYERFKQYAERRGWKLEPVPELG